VKCNGKVLDLEAILLYLSIFSAAADSIVDCYI
jgi:hypothetical protein